MPRRPTLARFARRPSGALRSGRVPAAALAAVVASGGCAGGTPDPAPGSGPPIVQPGAPGEGTRVRRGEELDPAALPGYTEADVAFLRGMIPHHAQALEMTALVPDRTDSEDIRQLALRIEISQQDEIALMERWLRARGEALPDPAAHADHRMPPTGGEAEGAEEATGGQGGLMPGMLTPEQMADLAAARGDAFDRLFLEYMIQHHEGAIVMVRELFASPGAAQDSEIYQFAADVDADQLIEIRRMRRMLEARREPQGGESPNRTGRAVRSERAEGPPRGERRAGRRVIPAHLQTT